MTGKLLAVAQELVSSRERAGLGDPSDGVRAHNAPPEVVSHGVWEEPLGSLRREPPSPSWPLRSPCHPCPSQPYLHASLYACLLQGTLENAVEQLELYRRCGPSRRSSHSGHSRQLGLHNQQRAPPFCCPLSAHPSAADQTPSCASPLNQSLCNPCAAAA